MGVTTVEARDGTQCSAHCAFVCLCSCKECLGRCLCGDKRTRWYRKGRHKGALYRRKTGAMAISQRIASHAAVGAKRASMTHRPLGSRLLPRGPIGPASRRLNAGPHRSLSPRGSGTAIFGPDHAAPLSCPLRRRSSPTVCGFQWRSTTIATLFGLSAALQSTST
jgi:hypothetical protein